MTALPLIAYASAGMAADHFLVQEARERGYHVEPVEYEIEVRSVGRLRRRMLTPV